MALRNLTEARGSFPPPPEEPAHPFDISLTGPGESWDPANDVEATTSSPPSLDISNMDTVVPESTVAQRALIKEEANAKKWFTGGNVSEGAEPSSEQINVPTMQRYAEAMLKFLSLVDRIPPSAKSSEVQEPTPKITWEDLWAHTLKAEGGYANNPLDPGGETKFGISKSAYPSLNIASLTPDDAKAIFKVDYFDKVGGDVLLQINPGVAAHVVDMAFNAGPQTAINLLYDSVGLPRKNGITDELLERISRDESAIADYSKARLAYYSSLYNAPTFIKGWINRVSNLNKILGTKSGLGGAYAAARDLDVEYLVQNQYGSYRNAQPRFRDVDASERGYLTERERVLRPGFDRALGSEPATINDRPNSSIADVFGASYKNKYYVNQSAGQNVIIDREAMAASELNRQALGEQFSKSTLESMTFGLYGGVTNLKDFQKELEEFKKNYPDVKLPVSDVSQIYEAAGQKLKAFEERYSNLESGSFSTSLGDAAAKLGHVMFGYFPGEMIGTLSDPKEMALMLATGGSASTIRQALMYGALGFLGEGALQVGVQRGRQALGLEGGFQQGLENALSYGVGTAAFGALAVGIKNLWKLGSKEASKAADVVANQVDDIVSKQALAPDSLYVKKEAGDLRELGKIYKSNAYGHDYRAKLQFEKRMGEATEDLASNKPVRLMQDDIRKFVGNDKQFVSDMTTAIKNSGPDGEFLAKKFQEQARAWDKFKKSQITRTVYSNIDDVEHSMVPITKPGSSELYSFSNVDDAHKFLKSKEAEGLISDYAIDIYPDPKGKGYFLGRSADLEPSLGHSGRMVGDDVVEDVVSGVKVRGFKDSDDLLLAKQYPDHSRIREFKQPEISDTPKVYPKDQAILDAEAYVKQLDDYVKTSPKVNLSIAEERLIRRLEEMDQAHIKSGNKGPAMMDISDTLGVEERVSVREFIDEIREERSGLKGMMDCMVAG